MKEKGSNLKNDESISFNCTTVNTLKQEIFYSSEMNFNDVFESIESESAIIPN